VLFAGGGAVIHPFPFVTNPSCFAEDGTIEDDESGREGKVRSGTNMGSKKREEDNKKRERYHLKVVSATSLEHGTWEERSQRNVLVPIQPSFPPLSFALPLSSSSPLPPSSSPRPLSSSPLFSLLLWLVLLPCV
jgi:hypothetical protein